VIKPGTNTSFAPLKQIDASVFTVGYAEAGPPNGSPMILLHGWPFDGWLSTLPPNVELQMWYLYYFATERGRVRYDKYRRGFRKLTWHLASPKWSFDDGTFNRSAAASENPDHVAIVIDSYRWRLDLVEGEPKYDHLEKRLAQFPVITEPAITMGSDANGALHPEPSTYAKKFAGRYEHRTVTGGIGHNLSQEATQAFAEAELMQ